MAKKKKQAVPRWKKLLVAALGAATIGGGALAVSNINYIRGEKVVEVGLQRPIDSAAAKAVANLPGVMAAYVKDDKTLNIKFTGGLDIQERILSSLVQLNVGVISYKPAASELEDAYLKLITSTL